MHNNGFSSGRDGREGKELQGIQRLSSDCSAVIAVSFAYFFIGGWKAKPKGKGCKTSADCKQVKCIPFNNLRSTINMLTSSTTQQCFN